MSLLDLIELEFGYVSIQDHYYQSVSPQRLLDGARSGMIAYLRERGVRDPQVDAMHARADGRGAVPAIDRDVGRTIERYGAKIDVRALVYATIRGELAALHDPYSVLFTKGQLAGFTRAIEGTSFAGVGIVLARDDAAAAWRVERVFDGGPAAKAGLGVGDVIGSVDGRQVGGLAADAVTGLLRGPAGTVVRLGVERGGAPLPAPLAVTRAVVTPPNVTARLLPPSVAYAALSSFDTAAPGALRRAFTELDAQGARRRILDLRRNGGGYEVAAVDVAALFVPGGPVATIVEDHGKRRTLVARGSPLPPKPLIVLVDGDSASGSELAAGAIRDRGAGRLVGTRTFGKGVVQTMYPLPDGAAIKLTSASYRTPAGTAIEHVGLTPDVVVSEPSGAVLGDPARDPQLARALELLAPAPAQPSSAGE